MAVKRTRLTIMRGYGNIGPSGYSCHGCGHAIRYEQRYCYLINATDGERFTWGDCCARQFEREEGR